ncbi:hypothetical protein [Phaeocystidibacter luteus]|uniref:Uncharacterized protein n=1 Tax=Phaeocystidibacter luteus TaxID=911197 RepID=A0A6N6RGD2_9FLAO|nr:hypothetical protein [Phaeocystidibacter luteus]KAB2810148.1 hypothetical protein F8C67_07905 [Phaeocystidibacter luteus]
MSGRSTPSPSFLGPYWSAFRKWFYPAWLIYETSIRFIEYASQTQAYVQTNITDLLGDSGAEVLSMTCGVLVFLICFLFLAVPGGFILYQFFKKENLSGTLFEQKFKFYF